MHWKNTYYSSKILKFHVALIYIALYQYKNTYSFLLIKTMQNCYFSRIIIFPCTIIKSCKILSSHFSLPNMPMRTRVVCITRMMRYDEWLDPTARILIHILLPPLNTPTCNRFGPDRNPRRNQRLILCGFPYRELRTRVLLVPIATPHDRPCLRLRTRSRNRRCCRLMRRRHPARQPYRILRMFSNGLKS